MANLQKINVQEIYTRQRQSLRPWFEFFNTAKFKAPANTKTGNWKRKTSEIIISLKFFDDYWRMWNIFKQIILLLLESYPFIVCKNDL